MTMKYELYIFDLDGTILDTEQDLAISVNYALSVFDFPTLSIGEVADRTGNGVKRLIEKSVPKNTDAKTTLAVLDVFKQHYFYHCADHTKPYDGIIELLETLKANGFRWAPSDAAWQRQLNPNAFYAANRIDFIKPENGERPTDLQPKAPKKTEPER